MATGTDCHHTAVEWAGYKLELFCQYVYDKCNMTMFEGISGSTRAYLVEKLNIIKKSQRIIAYGNWA